MIEHLLDQRAVSGITGRAESTDFPTQAPFQSTNHGGFNAFVTKFSTAGSSLVYSTYLGGSKADLGQGIAVDPSGNAYVTGYATSTDFPLQRPVQPANGARFGGRMRY